MATAKDLNIFVEEDNTGLGVRIVSPTGVPKLNEKGVELANIWRGEGDRVFAFAEPVSIIGLRPDGMFLIQVAPHTQMLVDPDHDNYFL